MLATFYRGFEIRQFVMELPQKLNSKDGLVAAMISSSRKKQVHMLSADGVGASLALSANDALDGLHDLIDSHLAR